jgi:hypothetical protein
LQRGDGEKDYGKSVFFGTAIPKRFGFKVVGTARTAAARVAFLEVTSQQVDCRDGDHTEGDEKVKIHIVSRIVCRGEFIMRAGG